MFSQVSMSKKKHYNTNIVRMIKNWTLENVFIPFFLIYICFSVFTTSYVINQKTLANPYELHSYLFIVASVAVFLKIFIFNYITLLFNFAQKNWFMMAFNLSLFSIQFFFASKAAFSLTQSSYILYPIQNLLIASGIFYLQNLFQKHFKFTNFTLVGVLVYLVMFILTIFRLLDNDPRLWNSMGLTALGIEACLFFLFSRSFFKLLKS